MLSKRAGRKVPPFFFSVAAACAGLLFAAGCVTLDADDVPQPKGRWKGEETFLKGGDVPDGDSVRVTFEPADERDLKLAWCGTIVIPRGTRLPILHPRWLEPGRTIGFALSDGDGHLLSCTIDALHGATRLAQCSEPQRH